MKNLFQFVALRHLRMRPGRTVLAVLGIACGIALYVAISMINDSTSGYFRESMAAVSGKATLGVSAGELGFDEKLADQVEAVPGVKDVAPVLENRTFVPETNESLVVVGVDLLQEKSVRDYKTTGKKVVGDSLTFISRPDSLIVTEGFAASHNLKIGSVIELTTAHGRAKFTVRGILAPTGLAKAYGGAMAVMDIDAARIAFGKEGKTDRVDVVTAPGVDVDAVAKKIEAAIGPRFTVERPEMASAQMERMVHSFQFMSHFLSMMALIVGVMMISNSVSISVAERRKEIGTLRALGTKRRGILALFVAEAVAMGSLGALIGAFIGRLLAGRLVGAVTHAMTEQFTQRIEAGELKFDAQTILSAVAIGACAALVASFIPAYRATKVEPVDAMKRKDTGAGVQKGIRRFSGILGAVLVACAIAGSLYFSKSDSKMAPVFLQGFAIIGSALLGPALVIWLVALVRPIAAERWSLVPRLAVENVLRNPKRTGTNVTSLMVGLILVVLVACVNSSFKGTLMRFFGRILHADMIVSATGRLQSHQTTMLDENLKARIEEQPGILGVYELREAKFDYQGEKILLKYYGEPPRPDKTDERRYDIFDTIDVDSEVAGNELFHAKQPVLMVSENFYVNFKKTTGDTITLMTPKGPRDFKIAAMVNEYANPLGTIYMSRDTYRGLFDEHVVSGFAVKVKKDADPVQIRSELDKRLSKDMKITILLNDDIRKEVARVIDSSFSYTHAIEIAALVVALMGLMNTLLITVMERTRELGLTRAVGMTRKHVARMILLEAASQGGLGAIISALLGTVLGLLWVTQNLAHSLGWVVKFYVPWASLGTTIALGVLVSIAAAWYPARRAAALQIVDALDYE